MNKLFIFSAALERRTKLGNDCMHDNLVSYLEHGGVKVLECKGRYKGTEELSVLVHEKDMSREHIAQLCRGLAQECFLELVPYKHGMYQAYFVPASRSELETPSTPVFAGYFRSYSKEKAELEGLDYTSTKTSEKEGVVWVILPTPFIN